ncbi:MAG: hypothetical protein ACE14S_10040 [Candidatus Bathyarchaeia archaeon]
MDKNLKIWLVLITVILAIAGFMAAFWAAYTFNQPRIVSFQTGPGGAVQIQRVNPGDIEFYYVARSVVSTINIALLIVLVMTYVSIYIKTRSEFTIGLMIFAVVFLIKDLTSSSFVVGAFGFGAFGLGPFALLPDLFELAALSVLLYLSVKY